MVLANKGFLMLDEMDKMSVEDTSAMHEAMESQIISISKANIQATLKAETTILAAANPKFGRFDPYKQIASQIDLTPTLLSRFDLIFPVRDLPNREKDDKIASHVLHLHQKPQDIITEIPIDLFKKYILYVRQNIHPRLSDGAVDEIKNFYVTLRNAGQTGDGVVKPIPITARQLEALIRLSEGSAKIRLSNKVMREDAKKAIEFLRHCLLEVGIDPETGNIDIDSISTGITASQRSRIIVVRDIIRELEKMIGNAIPLEKIVDESNKKGIKEDQVNDIIDRLKREGEIFEPKHGTISRL